MVENTREHIGHTRIKVLGIGGGGSNAVARMFRERIPGIEYAVVNTDSQALLRCDVPLRLGIGDELTEGKGVGGNPETGARAAEESREDLYDAVRDADMVFIAAGMGGGTGTGAAPIVAQIVREEYMDGGGSGSDVQTSRFRVFKGNDDLRHLILQLC